MTTQIKPDTNEIWAASGAIIDPGPAKVDTGWVVGEEPLAENMNYLQNNYGEFIQHVNLEGVPVWDTTTEYEVDALVKGSDGLVYKGLTATNQSNDPTSSPVNWEEHVGITTAQEANIPTADQKAALDNANAPTAGNPVVTASEFQNLYAANAGYSGILKDDGLVHTGTLIAIPLAATWVPVTGWTANMPSISGLTPDSVAGTITVGAAAAGTYRIEYNLAWAPNWGVTAWNNYFGIQVNGDAAGSGLILTRSAFVGTQIIGTFDITATGSIITPLVDTDVVQLWVQANAINKDIIHYGGDLSLTRM